MHLARMPRGVMALVWAQMASQMGDAAFSVLLIWAVVERTESKFVVGAVAMLNYLPILLFGMAGGVAADRLPRRGLMIASDAARASICVLLVIAGWMGIATPWVLAAAGFGLFTASAFFNPARDAYIPSLAEDRDLVKANSLIQTSVQVGWLFGPALCAAFLKWMPAVQLFACAGALFLVSVFFLLGLRRTAAAERRPASSGAAQLFEGISVAWGDVRLRWLMVITAVDNLFIMGPAIVGTPLLVKNVLHGSGQSYAMMEALLALGVFAGLPITIWLNRRAGQGRIIIAGIFLDGITYLPLLWAGNLWSAGVAVALHGISIPLITVTRTSLVQRIAPPLQLGRVFALINITVLGFTAISSGLTGLVATALPVNVIFGVIAVAAALCGPIAWTSRKFREA